MQSRRRRRDAIAHAAEDSWQHFQLYLHGCQVFAEDEATSTALQRHLVRTTAATLMDWLLHYQVSSLYPSCHSQGWIPPSSQSGMDCAFPRQSALSGVHLRICKSYTFAAPQFAKQSGVVCCLANPCNDVLPLQ